MVGWACAWATTEAKGFVGGPDKESRSSSLVEAWGFEVTGEPAPSRSKALLGDAGEAISVTNGFVADVGVSPSRFCCKKKD